MKNQNAQQNQTKSLLEQTNTLNYREYDPKELDPIFQKAQIELKKLVADMLRKE